MKDVSRKEKKYVISRTEALSLYKKFSQVLHQDEHNNLNDGYMVRSLYFDTIDDSDYMEKEDGYEYRKKIRLRIYSSNQENAKLEMKEKTGENQRKRSLTITKENAIEMCNGNYECLLSYNNDFALELYLLMVQRMYLPKCIVEYQRCAFIVLENDIRLTLDSKIKATEINFNIFDENLLLYPVTNYDDVTLEVKYNGFLLSYIKDLLSSCDRMPTSNSKYCLGRNISKHHGG